MTSEVPAHQESYDRLNHLIDLNRLLYRLSDRHITQPFDLGTHTEIVNLLSHDAIKDDLLRTIRGHEADGSDVTKETRTAIASALGITEDDWAGQNWRFMEHTIQVIVATLPDEAGNRLMEALQQNQGDYDQKAAMISRFLREEIDSDTAIPNDSEQKRELIGKLEDVMERKGT